MSDDQDGIEDEEARRRRAEQLRDRIAAARRGDRAPASPREFTDRAAREAAEEERRREGAEPDDDA